MIFHKLYPTYMPHIQFFFIEQILTLMVTKNLKLSFIQIFRSSKQTLQQPSLNVE